MKTQAAAPNANVSHPPAVLLRPAAVGTAVVLLAMASAGCDTLHCFLSSPSSATNAKTRQEAQTKADLQVTVEVRFISVSDNFFERIGIDFDLAVPTTEALGVFDPFGFGLGDCSLDGSPKVGPSSLTGGADNVHHIIPSNFLGGPLPLLLPTSDAANNTVRAFPSLPQGFDNSSDLLSTLAVLNGLRAPTEPLADPSLQPGLSLLGTFLDDTQLEVILRAVDQSSTDTILSAPKVTLFNGQRAIIMEAQEQGQAQDFEPAIANLARSIDPNVQTLNTGIVLDFVPRISPDGSKIDLTIFPGTRGAQLIHSLQVQFNNQTDVIQVPVFQLSQIQTSVSVPDGGTLLLGGFKTSPSGERQMGLPFLHKIPIINRLFRSQAFVQENQALVLMVTPRIIVGE